MPQITVMNQYQQASQAISAKPVIPGAQEIMLVERAELLIGEGAGRIDRFLNGPWNGYKAQVEHGKPDYFAPKTP
jgi:hypothetical protein